MKNKQKLKRLFATLILISTIFMSIGYALVSNTNLYMSGNVSALEQEGIFITDITCYEINGYNNNMCSEENIKSANKTLLHSNITLDNNSSSTITYQITFHNNSNTTYYFDKVVYMNDQNTYSNENIIFELKDENNATIEKNTQLLNDSYINFYITFKYKDGTNITDKNLNSYLNFKFNPSYKVTFNANGGSVGISNKYVINTENYGELPTPTRVGYVFKGWYTSASGGSLITSETTVDLTSDYTLYAKWSCNMLAEEATWYNRGSTPRNNITEIQFVKDYVPTEYTDSWNIDADNSGSLKAYVIDNKTLIVSVSQEDKIYANANSSYLFSGHSSYEEPNRYFINLTKITGLELLDTSLATTMYKMFYYCNNLVLVNLSNFNTNKVTNFGEMFGDCNSIQNIDLSSFNTSNATSFAYMFSGCSSLSSLDLHNFNTSKVTNMSYMFHYAKKITSLDISNFDFSKVTNMEYMFSNTSYLTEIILPTTPVNMSKLTTLGRAFYECNNLKSLDLSFITYTSSLKTTINMFFNCYSLENITFADTFDTSNVTDMGSMFAKCEKLTTLDLSMFDTSKVTSFSYVSTFDSTLYPTRGMFTGNKNLKTIYVSNKFVTTNATDPEIGSVNMFLDCNSLVGGNGTTYDSNYIDKTYARIDGLNNLSGYFTLK